MDNKKTVVVNIVNRDYPPYKGVTGESAAELTKYLLDAGFQVNVIHIDAPVWGKDNKSLPIGNILKVKMFYYGKNKYLRLFANLISGYFLIKKTKKQPCDITIVMTDPSLLNMWASLLLRKKQWILWAMDLYPESFVAGNLISVNNFLYKKLYQWTIKNAPQRIISLGPLQATHLRNRYNGVSDIVSLPCGIYDANQHLALERPQWANDLTKIYLGYCGNLGAAHSLDFLFAVIDNLDTNRFKLVISAYGLKAEALKRYAQDKNGIELIPPVKREHLKYIDIHLVSLLPQWTHISVPSKTVSSVCAGSTFLYYGKEDSDNWFLLKKAGWLIPADSQIQEGVKSFFQQFNMNSLKQKKEAAQELAKTLNTEKLEVFQQIAANIIKHT